MARFDLSEFPLVRLAWDGDLTPEAIDACFSKLEALQRRCSASGERFVVVSSGATNASAKVRQQISKRSDSIPKELASTSLAVYVVVEQPLIRGILTALKWMSPRMATVHPVATLEQGIAAAKRTIASEIGVAPQKTG